MKKKKKKIGKARSAPKKKKAARAKSKVKAKPKRKTIAKKSKKPAKKAAKKAAAPKPGAIVPPAGGIELGRVEDYFAKIGVIALTLKHEVSVGSHIHILGHTTHLEQTVDSMQIEHQPVTIAREKDAVGIKVTARVRRGDHVYLIP